MKSICKGIILGIFLITTGFTTAGAATCVDPDGDGWGWDGTNSCQMGQASATTTPDDNDVAIDTSCVDPDGDGWGWNGTDSCYTGSDSGSYSSSNVNLSCPFSPSRGDVLVNFGSVGELFSYSKSGTRFITGTNVSLGTTLPAGKYRISIATKDFADGNGNRNHSQPNEVVRVVFKSTSGGTLATTNKSQDLADYTDKAVWQGVVNNSLYLGSATNSIRVEHGSIGGSNPNSVHPNCMLIEPLETKEPTPEISNPIYTDPTTGLKCNQVFENNFVRYDRAYQFNDSIKNTSNVAIYLNKYNVKFANPSFLDKGGDFDWTSAIRNANYRVGPGKEVTFLSTTSTSWRIAKKPSSRSTAKKNNSDFMIHYTAYYDAANTPNDSSDDKAHTECMYYSVTSCGDGVVDGQFETCDPNDSSKKGWGNSGCSNTCEPLNHAPEVTCDSLNVNTTNIYAPGEVSFTCTGKNVDSTKIKCGNGQTVNAATGKCQFGSAGTYQMVCTMTGNGVSQTSNSCKKTITVSSTAPSIEIQKTALDGSDSQVVGSSTTARFKIKVRNVGNENIDRHIVLSDPKVSACAGTVSLPSNKPSTFHNFKFYGNGNHSNQVLEPGEGFEYTCEKSGITSKFTNVASVSGKGKNSGKTVSDSDSTEVYTQSTPVALPSCPYNAGGNVTVVDLTPAGRLWSKEGQNNRRTLNLGKTLSAGDYKVSLFAADAYQSRPSTGVQPREIIKAKLKYNGSTTATTNATTDLEDGVAIASVDQVVNQSLTTNKYNQLEVIHAAFVDNSNANSVQPICARLEKISDPQSICPFTASGDEIVIDYSANGIRLRSGGPISFEHNVGQTIPAGNYQISLAAYDAYSSRVNVNQPHEQYKVIFKNSSNATITTSGISGDVPDNVAVGRWQGQVNDSLYIGQAFSRIKVMHAYPDRTDWNSVQAACMKLKPLAATNEPSIRINKIDNNGTQDRDGNIGNDTQTILVGHTSRFNITVTNDGNESLKSIVLSDVKAAKCAGAVSLPSTYPNTWSDFSATGNGDQFLDPGESFTYSCDKPQTTSSYTNTASVAATGKNSGTAVDDSDNSAVIVDTETDDDVCPYTATGNKILVTFNNSTLGDWNDTVRTEMYSNFGTIPKGRYRISLAAFDGYKDRSNPQPNEQYSVVFRSNPSGTEIVRTNNTQDVRDDSNNAAWYGVVNENLYIPQNITKLSTDHIFQSSSGKYNSLKAKCMLLEPIGTDGEPEISIVKTDANTGDRDGTVGDDTQTIVSGTASTFNIRVTNSGTEDLTNVVVTDTLAPNCAGSVTLPGTKPATWSNFQVGGTGNNANAVFEPGEYFEYTCSKANTISDYVNIAEVDATGKDSGEAVNDADPSVVVVEAGTGPSIIINKSDSNLSDQDGSIGNDTQTISTGSDSVFRIRVTNNGDEALKDLVLTDTLAPNCAGSVTLPATKPATWSNFVVGGSGNNANALLEVGEYFEFTCKKPNTTEEYTNIAGVDAVGNTSNVTVNDEDPSTVLVTGGPTPSIQIVKTDANLGDQDGSIGNDTQTVITGTDAVFNIRVVNTGAEALKDIVVADTLAPNCAGSVTLPGTKPATWSNFSVGGSGNNGNALLEPGEYFTYNCSKANTTAGYTNIAEVDAVGNDSGEAVEDDDPSIVKIDTVTGPSIKIDKTDANIDDTDGSMGNDTQDVVFGSEAVFKIRVTNNGTENLTNIVVSDALAPNCAGTATLPDTVPATWKIFTVSGLGDNTNGILEPGEYFEFTCEKANTEVGYTNEAGVGAEGVDSGTSVGDTDTSDVTTTNGPTPQITIDKIDNNVFDSDGVRGNDSQSVTTGTLARFKIRVTNSGGEDLKDIVITDDIAPNCAGSVTLPDTKPTTWASFRVAGSGDHTDNLLQPGEFIEYSCAKGNTQANYVNVASVDGVGNESGDSVNDEDDSPVFVQDSAPSVKIEKTDANTADKDGNIGDDSQLVDAGEKAVFKIRVTNDGNERLKEIVITDAIAPNCGGSVTLPDTKPATWSNYTVGGAGVHTNAFLEVGEYIEYTCEKDNTVADYTNIATVNAKSEKDDTPVNDTDDSEVEIDGVVASIEVDKTDDNAANDTDGSVGNDTQTVAVGDKATFKITVTNNGSDDLTDIVLADAIEPSCAGTVTLPSTIPSSFLNFDFSGTGDHTDAVLSPGESFSYNCSKQNTTADYTNTVEVAATGVTTGTDVDDSDATQVKIPAGPACTGLTVVDANGQPTHKTDVTCTGTEVTKFEIDCGNGEVFTQAGNGSGTETFTKECTYTSKGTFTPTCTVNDTITNNSCKKQVVVKTSSSSSSGTSPQCTRIDILDENSSSSNTLDTQIECIGNSKVKSIKIEFGDGEYEIANDVSGGKHVFDARYTNNTGSRKAYQAKCYVSGSKTISDRNSSAWKSKLKCQDNVSLGSTGGSSSSGSSGGGYCGDGKVQRPNSDDVVEECDKVEDGNGGLEWPSTCNTNCTLRSTSSSSSGVPSGYCGDGVIQSPNDDGNYEECERQVDENGNIGGWTEFCKTNNVCKLKDVTELGNGSIFTRPEGNTVIGNNQDAYFGLIPSISNDGGDRIVLNHKFCVYNTVNTNVLTGGNGVCTPQVIGMLRPGDEIFLHSAQNYFKGKANEIPDNKTFTDTMLVASIEDFDGVQTQTRFAAKRNVRVSKPSVATVGGGVSLMKEETDNNGNTVNNVADVHELATAPAADGSTFGSAENTNFQGASVSDGDALSSNAGLSEGTVNNTALDQGTDDNQAYGGSVDTIDEVVSGGTDTNPHSISEMNPYNGIANVYVIDNKNLHPTNADLAGLSGPTTYIINNADLVIEEDLTPSFPVAFIVRGGNIQVRDTVETLNGSFVAIPKDSSTGKMLATGGSTQRQLLIEGGVYADKSDLIGNRTYISNYDSDQINVGTIVYRGASLFKETPPLLRSFINEYTEETEVAR